MDLLDGTKTVRDIVVADYRTADVFKKWGINYCCGGNLPLGDACTLKNIDRLELTNDIKKATQDVRVSNILPFNSWSSEFLVDYIIHVHHDYLRTTLPALKQSVDSFVNGHLKKYPHLGPVRQVVFDLAAELEEHIEQEEESIFPYIKQISNTYNRKEVYGNLFVRTMRKPLAAIIDREHRRIADLLQELREKTNGYTFPDDACANHQVMYRKLQELDADLMQHKHLENNVLFPRAIEMEKSILQFS
jgi:regulator of cell morphogenesis and NO signaling